MNPPTETPRGSYTSETKKASLMEAFLVFKIQISNKFQLLKAQFSKLFSVTSFCEMVLEAYLKKIEFYNYLFISISTMQFQLSSVFYPLGVLVYILEP